MDWNGLPIQTKPDSSLWSHPALKFSSFSAIAKFRNLFFFHLPLIYFFSKVTFQWKLLVQTNGNWLPDLADRLLQCWNVLELVSVNPYHHMANPKHCPVISKSIETGDRSISSRYRCSSLFPSVLLLIRHYSNWHVMQWCIYNFSNYAPNGKIRSSSWEVNSEMQKFYFWFSKK